MDALAFQSTLSRQADATFIAARRQWRQMSTLNDWDSIASALTRIVAAGQVGAAAVADRFLLEFDVDPVGSINAEAFGGTASDGRPLDSLLYSAVIHARQSNAEKDAEILLAGEQWLQMLVNTQVADAGRMAASVGITARPGLGYIRQVAVPCCKRCAVLAGKWFRWNQGFLRHPGCRCVHRPATQADMNRRKGLSGDVVNGKGLATEISPGQIRDLTRAQRMAIADGADMNQVINAERGLMNSMFTTEGTTKRGWSSYVRREIARQRNETLTSTVTQVGRRGAVKNYSVTRYKPRPTPEAIYRYSESREEAVRLLAANGYIVGDLKEIVRLALP